MRAAGIWKALPPLMMVASGIAAFALQDVLVPLVPDGWLRTVEPWDVVLYMCMPIGAASLGYAMSRRVLEVALLRREMTGPVCPKCKSSLIGLRVETRGADPDPAQNRVRCPECGVNWRMLDVGLTPRDLMPREFDIASAGTRLPTRHE